MILDGLRPDDVYYEKKPEKPKRDAKTVPCNIEHHRFQQTRSTGYRFKKLRSLRTRLGFHVGLTHGKSLKTSKIEAQLFHFD